MTHEQLLQVAYLQGVKLACANGDVPLEKLSAGFMRRAASRVGRAIKSVFRRGVDPNLKQVTETAAQRATAAERAASRVPAASPDVPLSAARRPGEYEKQMESVFAPAERADQTRQLKDRLTAKFRPEATPKATPKKAVSKATPKAAPKAVPKAVPADDKALREKFTPGYASMMLPGAGAGALIGGLTANQGEGTGGAIKGGLIGAAAGAGARAGASKLFGRMGNIGAEAAGVAKAKGVKNAKSFLKARRDAAFKDPQMQRSALYGLGGAAVGGVGAGVGLNALFSGGGQQATQPPNYTGAPQQYPITYPSQYGPPDGYYR